MLTPKTPKRKLSKGAKTPYKKRQKQALVKRSTGSIYRGPAVSSQYVVKPLRFSIRRTFTGLSGAVDILALSTNSVFQPTAITSSNPRGFDQWATLYARYCVPRSKITVDFVCSETSASQFIAGVTVATNVASSTDPRDYLEARYVSYKIGGDISNVLRVEQVFEHNNWKKTNIMGDDNVQAVVTASPAEQWYFNVFIADLIAASSSTVYAIITVEYETRFFDAIDPTIS